MILTELTEYADYHHERIICNCGSIQQANVLYTALWPIYAHECTSCGAIITESDWCPFSGVPDGGLLVDEATEKKPRGSLTDAEIWYLLDEMVRTGDWNAGLYIECVKHYIQKGVLELSKDGEYVDFVKPIKEGIFKAIGDYLERWGDNHEQSC